jgi:tripartite-type tricarboxylate transporter receptor subunit TctC
MKKFFAALLMLFATGALGQKYTVVSSSSGGDIGYTIQRAALSKINFVSEFAPGGDGIIAPNKFVAKPPGDFLLMSSLMTQQVLAPMTRPELVEYKDSDFTPVTLLASTFFVVVSQKKYKIKELQGRVAVGGGNAIFIAQMLAYRSKSSIEIIPYKKATQVLMEAMGGDLEFALSQVGAAYPFIVSGKLHAIATTFNRRVSRLSDTPTLAEHYPDFVIPAAFGLYGQRGISLTEVDRLHKLVVSALEDQKIRDLYFANWLYAPLTFGPVASQQYVIGQRAAYAIIAPKALQR